MSLLSVLKAKQPPADKKVVELVVGGPVGRWFAARGWGAFTLPLPFLVLIFYWDNAPGLVRVHEFTHVRQDAANPFFLVTWYRYARAWWKGFPLAGVLRGQIGVSDALMVAYQSNEYEIAAYAVQSQAEMEHDGLPDWAKDPSIS